MRRREVGNRKDFTGILNRDKYIQIWILRVKHGIYLLNNWGVGGGQNGRQLKDFTYDFFKYNFPYSTRRNN